MGPSEGWTINKEFFEISFTLERAENRSGQPRFKIDDFFLAVVEFNFDQIVFNVSCFVTEGTICRRFRSSLEKTI